MSRSTGWWGMALLVATEATLFAVLISSYFYLRYQSGQWPPGGLTEPRLVVPLVSTVLLVATSGPLALAAATSRRAWALGAVAVALLLELAYVALQLDGYNRALEDFTPQTNAYGSLYYTLTGTHLAHVVAGAGMLVWALVRLRDVGLVAFYTHFVNAVAVAIYLTVYVTPRL